MAQETTSGWRPKAIRPAGWFFEDAGEEVLVYDPERHRVHCLNNTAVQVWHLCSGARTVSQISAELDVGIDSASRELVARQAVAQLADLGVIETAGDLTPRMSRRELVRRIGIGAVAALPLVTSMIAPTPASAANSFCVTNNGSCAAGGSRCCTNLVCCTRPNCNKTCVNSFVCSFLCG
jgi:hypothetical protein